MRPPGKGPGRGQGKRHRDQSGSRGGASRPRPASGRPDPRSRETDRARWVVGIHSCAEALKVRPKAVREIWLRQDWKSSEQLRELAEIAEKRSIRIEARSPGQIDAIGSGNQGVAIACTESPEVDWDTLASDEKTVVLILDGIEDPHNLGSMIRTGWLTGVSGIFIPEDRAVGLTPSVCKVASGGAEHVPVEAGHIPSAMERLKELGFWIYGLAEGGTRKPWDFKLDGKVAWVIGAEGSGIRKPTERACDELVRIPQVHTGSSYNASIAAAMALSETCRQFGKPE